MAYSKEDNLLFKLSKIRNQFAYTPIPESIDMESLLRQAHANGCLLYTFEQVKNLKHHKKKFKPFEQWIKATKMITIARHLEFDLLTKKFNENSIPFIPLKGILLSKLIYPSVELRDMLDIDILVKHSDVLSIHRVLTDLKYVQNYADPDIKEDLLPHLEDKKLQQHIDCIEFRRSGFDLEVHFKFLSSKISSQVPPEEIWTKSGTEEIQGTIYTTLSPEHLLINLATHCTRHNLMFGLRPISEIEATVFYYKEKLDWDKFTWIVERYDLIKLSYLPMYLASILYEAPVPEHILREMERKCGKSLVNLSNLIGQNFFERWKIPELGDTSYYFHIMKQRGRFRSLSRVFFPPVKLLKLKTPKKMARFPFIYLQYPLRFARLIKTYLPDLAKRIYYNLKAAHGRNN